MRHTDRNKNRQCITSHKQNATRIDKAKGYALYADE